MAVWDAYVILHESGGIMHGDPDESNFLLFDDGSEEGSAIEVRLVDFNPQLVRDHKCLWDYQPAPNKLINVPTDTGCDEKAYVMVTVLNLFKPNPALSCEC